MEPAFFKNLVLTLQFNWDLLISTYIFRILKFVSKVFQSISGQCPLQIQSFVTTTCNDVHDLEVKINTSLTLVGKKLTTDFLVAHQIKLETNQIRKWL